MGLTVSVFIATSLDGFIARENGGLDWLDAANKVVPKGEDCGYQNFFESVDVMVMGRKTYEKVLSFGIWPYEPKQVIVLSSNVVRIPEQQRSSVSFSSETPTELCDRLANEGAKRLYVDGGATIQRFLAEGLITDMTITVIPILLGSGIPLFGKLPRDIPLKPASVTHYDFGFVQTTYQVKNFSKRDSS